MNTEIEASFRITTPLFCAGANPDHAELRLTSFKGVLRFWWRALAWSVYDGDLTAIRHNEDLLFGSASTGQSQLVMMLTTDSASKSCRKGELLTTESGHQVGNGVKYLGYGLMESFSNRKKGTKAGELLRSCIFPPHEFTVSFLCRTSVDQKVLQILCDALRAMGLMGGMGARSRRGYGSLVLSSIRIRGTLDWEAPKSLAALREAIADLWKRYRHHGYPEYTALSDLARCVVLEAHGATPMEALDRIGREILRFRSWGHDGRILGGEPAERNFRYDHDLMAAPGPKRSYPLRIAFGLPQNYHFSKQPRSTVKPASGSANRRASPMLIHIHDYHATNVPPCVVVTFLPARFLPGERADGGTSFVAVDRSKVQLPDEDKLYRPVHGFIDRLIDPERRKEPFSAVGEIRI